MIEFFVACVFIAYKLHHPQAIYGSLVHTARVVSGECIQIGRTFPPPHTHVLLGGCPEQEPAAYDPPNINIHPASSPVHPPARNRGHVRAPPAHPRWHSRDLEPTPACTRGWEGEPGVRERRGRPETGLTANGPLAPGLMHAGPPNFGAGGCGFGVTAVPMEGASGDPGARTRPCPGGFVSGGTCGMYVDGRGIVRADASPLHPPGK